jgi:hypothetical protein
MPRCREIPAGGFDRTTMIRVVYRSGSHADKKDEGRDSYLTMTMPRVCFAYSIEELAISTFKVATAMIIPSM